MNNPGLYTLSGSLGGVTGMGQSPKCFLCQDSNIYTYVNIDFVNSKHLSKIKQLNYFEDFYGLCLSCQGQTIDLLSLVRDMELIKLPLWINHENIFVQRAIKNRLDGKINLSTCVKSI